MIAASDLKFFQSQIEGSAGGAISAIALPLGKKNLLFKDTTRRELDHGGVSYRKIFVVNSHATLPLINARLWLLTPPTSGEAISFAIGTADDIDPEPLDFQPYYATAPLSLGTMLVGDAVAIWMRKVCEPDNPEFEDNLTQFVVEGDQI